MSTSCKMAPGPETVRQPDNSKCRICMFPKQNLSSLFRRGLSMKVMKLADIKMYEGDGLPSTICLDCELEVNRCVNFIGQIQRADAKLREALEKDFAFSEMYEGDKALGECEPEPSTSQIDIEEFNVKQEISTLDNFLDEKVDPNSDSDHDHFDAVENNDGPENENVLNPLNHVDVIEDVNRPEGMILTDDPLGQEEPLIESHKSENETFVDPLTFMKQEPVPMDIDKEPCPEPSTSTSSDKETFNITEEMIKLNFQRNILHNRFAFSNNFANLNSFMIDNIDKSIHNYSRNDSQSNVKVSSKQLSKMFVKNPSVKKLSKNKTSKCAENKNKEHHHTFENPNECATKKPDSFCYVCYEECGTAELLEEHKLGKGFFCRVCTQEFENHDELKDHYYQNHNIYTCKICAAMFVTKRDFSKHKDEVHQIEKEFECETCNKRLSTRKLLARHKRAVHSEGENKFSCDICGKTFPLSSKWLWHMKSKHTAYKYIECKFCQKLCLGPERLKVHIKINHICSDDIKCARCDICGKLFKKLSTLKYHQQKMHDDTVSICTVCGHSVKGELKMKWHMRIEHSQPGTYTCKQCNEQFDTQLKLTNHVKKHYSKRGTPTPAFCEICGKQYTGSLKTHMMIHSDEKPFVCDICGASFKLKVVLTTHKRVHSNASKYSCGTCGMAFKWKQTFTNHMKKCSSTLSSNNEECE